MIRIKDATIERLRKEYPAGCRVRLERMNDVQAPPIGTEGTVIGVDDIGSIMVDWDNGSSLSVAYGEDRCSRIKKPKPVVEYNSRGESGNIFWILAAVQRIMKKQGRSSEYQKLWERVQKSGSYEEALRIIGEEVTLRDTAE